MEIGPTIRVGIFYAAGLPAVSAIFLFPLTLLAGAVRVFIFHRISRRNSMGMEPSTVIGLTKQNMDRLLLGIGYAVLLGIYSLLFFRFF